MCVTPTANKGGRATKIGQSRLRIRFHFDTESSLAGSLKNIVLEFYDPAPDSAGLVSPTDNVTLGNVLSIGPYAPLLNTSAAWSEA